MIRYLRWSPLAKAFASKTLSQEQIQEAAAINSKLLCLLAVREASKSNPVKGAHSSMRKTITDLLQKTQIQPWNWYDLARANAYLHISPLHEPPSPGYMIGGLLAKHYIHSIPAKSTEYTTCVEQLISEGCWDDIDTLILLDDTCTKQQLNLLSKQLNRQNDVPQYIKVRISEVQQDVQHRVKTQQFFRPEALKKPMTKPIEVRNEMTLRLLIQAMEEICSCQPDVLNSDASFYPIVSRILAFIETAAVFNSIKTPLEDFQYETLFKLYCWLIDLKGVMEVAAKVQVRGKLSDRVQLELMKTIGRVGVVLEKAQPQRYMESLVPTICKYRYASSPIAIQAQLSMAAIHFRELLKQHKQVQQKHHSLAKIFIDNPSSKFDDLQLLTPLPFNLCLQLYAKLEQRRPGNVNQLPQRLKQSAGTHKLTLLQFFEHYSILQELGLLGSVGHQCNSLLDFYLAVSTLHRLYPRSVPIHHQNIIKSMVPSYPSK